MIKPVILLVLFLAISPQLYSQVSEVDSLKEQVTVIDEEGLPALYMDIFVQYVYDDSDSALKYARLANEFANKYNNALQYMRSEYAIGFVFKNTSLYDSAMSHYSKGLDRADGNLDINDVTMLETYNRLLNGLGSLLIDQGNYDSALVYLFESLNYRRESDVQLIDGERDSSDYYYNLSVIETNIGKVFLKISDYSESEKLFKEALDHKKRANAAFERQLLNLGLVYYEAYSEPFDENFRKALDVNIEVLESCDSCSSSILFEAYNNLGVLYLNTDSIDLARENLEMALEYAQGEENISSRLYAILNIATMYEESGRYADAIDLLNRGKRLADSLHLPPLQAENYKMLASVHRNAGNNSLAYDYLLMYDSLNRQIFSEELISGIKNVLVDQNQRTNDVILEERDDTIESIKEARLYLSIIVILAFLILFIVIYNNRKSQKVNQKLSEANKTIEQTNEQLQNVNLSLEEKVKDRTKELKKANEALKQSNLELDNFIYKTSHDIRGPLATLQGICNVALLDVKDEKAVDYLSKLNLTATKLNEILSKLLIINQINNSEISKSPILLDEVIQQVVLENANIVEDKHIETKLSIEKDIKLRSDEDLIRIILSNLLNNAYKYYKKSYSVNSFVEVKVFKNNIHIQVEVIDNGIGIDKNAHNKIFEIFSKATEMSDSAGLGLYLVKLSVEKLGGTINLKRTKEGYTMFVVVLPLHPINES